VNAPAVDTATLLALERTRVAYERTMMGWVRTGTSLITFGFAVYKFFQLDQAVKLSGRMLIGPREFAMALILIGLLSLVLGTAEHARDLRALRRLNPQLPRSLSRLVSIAMVLLGVVSLAAVVTHA
jgi:putative membrane protein